MANEINLVGVVNDGYDFKPFTQPISINRGDDGYVNVAVIDSNQVSTTITGTVTLSVRNPYDPTSLLFENVVVASNSSSISFYLSGVDTDITSFPYLFDVVLVDSLHTSHLIPPSVLSIDGSVYKSGQ